MEHFPLFSECTEMMIYAVTNFQCLIDVIYYWKADFSLRGVFLQSIMKQRKQMFLTSRLRHTVSLFTYILFKMPFLLRVVIKLFGIDL